MKFISDRRSSAAQCLAYLVEMVEERRKQQENLTRKKKNLNKNSLRSAKRCIRLTWRHSKDSQTIWLVGWVFLLSTFQLFILSFCENLFSVLCFMSCVKCRGEEMRNTFISALSAGDLLHCDVQCFRWRTSQWKPNNSIDPLGRAIFQSASLCVTHTHPQSKLIRSSGFIIAQRINFQLWFVALAKPLARSHGLPSRWKARKRLYWNKRRRESSAVFNIALSA